MGRRSADHPPRPYPDQRGHARFPQRHRAARRRRPFLRRFPRHPRPRPARTTRGVFYPRAGRRLHRAQRRCPAALAFRPPRWPGRPRCAHPRSGRRHGQFPAARPGTDLRDDGPATGDLAGLRAPPGPAAALWLRAADGALHPGPHAAGALLERYQIHPGRGRPPGDLPDQRAGKGSAENRDALGEPHRQRSKRRRRGEEREADHGRARQPAL